MSTVPEHPLVRMHARASHPETRDGTALAWIPDPTASSPKIVRWSYGELWSVASSAAAKVRTALEGVHAARLSDMQDMDGLSPTVGLLVEDGVELPVAILAILLAGGAVVPVGATDPPARIKDVLEDAGCSVAIASDDAGDGGATRRLREAWTEAGRADFTVIPAASLLEVSESREVFSAGESTPPPAFPTNKLSHVFFTSGSTGRPKGCLATHGGLPLYCDAKNKSLGVSDDSVVLVASPHSFDPSLGDFLGAWRAGCVAATAPRSHLFASMGACLAASGATHVLTTPSMLSTINPATDVQPNLPNLRVVALGGEPMPEALARAWLPAVRRLVNGYGVTECTVYQAFRDVESVETRRAIGGSIAGCEMLFAKEPGDDPSVLLDTAGDPDGTLAEVWFAGPLVGLGYANAPVLTSERYSVNVHDGRRFFRTGDVCKLVRRGDGSAHVEVVGRRDSQVKINGQRVELGEVEAAVCASAPRLVAECAVSTPRLDAAEPRSKAIVAWCVPPLSSGRRPKTLENAGGRESFSALRADALRWLVASRVPPHMVPSRFGVAWVGLPTTATGKAARSVVAKWAPPPPPNREGNTTHAGSGEETEAVYGRGFEPGTSETRARVDAFAGVVADAWSAELGSEVTSSSRFAELGGDSVAALRVCQAIAASFADNDDDASPGTSSGSMNGRKDGGGTFGEALVGALAPARVVAGAGSISLAAHVASLRSAAIVGELGTRAAELARGDSDDCTLDGTPTAIAGDGDGDGESAPTPGDRRTEEGASLLRRAAFEGDAECVEQLLDAGVDVEGAVGVPSRVPSSTPLHVACGGGSRDRDGRAAAALLSRGASPRARNRRGQTAFIVAAARGPNSLLAQILERGGDAGAADDDGQTALHVAARAGAPASVVAAVAAAADGAPSPITIFKNARNDKSSRGPKANSRNDKSRGGSTTAARRNTHGGGGVRAVDRVDAWGRTPLHWAAVNGHRAACVALLDAGASTNLTDDAGETPTAAAERRALCSARERPDVARASTWGDIATLLGGSGRTKHLKARLAARASEGG